MSRFSYQAVMGTGEHVDGTVHSRDRLEAVRKVRSLGYHPIRVERVRSGSERGLAPSRWLGRIKVSDLAVFTRQLASLLHAGLPMVQALTTLRQQSTSPRLGLVVHDIEESLARDGGSLADALENHPRAFNPVFRGLVRAGEEGGNLVAVLSNLARHLSQSAKLQGQVVSAFIYPLFLAILGSAAVFVLMAFVIPRFEVLFASFGRQLPWPTVMLIAVSSFMAAWWWAVLAAGAALAVFGSLLLRRPIVREALDRRLLNVPVLGLMFLRLEVARIARTLGALVDGGVRILDALRITADIAKNLAVKQSFATVIQGVAGGEPLADLFDQTGLYPPVVVNLVRTGETTGELPEMLQELAAIYEDEAERAVTGAVKLLEPMLIVVMGGVIAGIVAAVILPIFQASALAG